MPPESEQRFSIGVIPDFSTTPLYAVVVLGTRDDPRLLALWCHVAFWQRVDDAFGMVLNSENWVSTWAERTGIPARELGALTMTLINRKLLAEDGSILRWTLQQASSAAVLPYSNELRRRAGLATLAPTQTTLFPEEGRDARG